MSTLQNALEVWYRPDKLCTLHQGSSRHLSWAEGMWLIARMLVNEVLNIARTLAYGLLHIARMLASGVWVYLPKKYYRDGLLPKVV